MRSSRCFALTALLAASPILLIKLPWLLPTVSSLQNAIAELSVDGTLAYSEDRANRISRGIFAVTLYLLGLVMLTGLVGILMSYIRGKSFLCSVWVILFVMSCGLVVFEGFSLGEDTDPIYSVIFVCLPVLLVFISITAFVMTLKSPT